MVLGCRVSSSSAQVRDVRGSTDFRALRVCDRRTAYPGPKEVRSRPSVREAVGGCRVAGAGGTKYYLFPVRSSVLGSEAIPHSQPQLTPQQDLHTTPTPKAPNGRPRDNILRARRQYGHPDTPAAGSPRGRRGVPTSEGDRRADLWPRRPRGVSRGRRGPRMAADDRGVAGLRAVERFLLGGVTTCVCV